MKIAKSLMLSTMSRRLSSASTSACSTRLALSDLVLELAAARLILASQQSGLGEIALDLHLADHPAHDRLEVIEKIGGLGNEVAHTGAQGLDQQLLVFLGCDQDGGNVMAGFPDLPEELEPARPGGEVLVENDELDFLTGDEREALGGCGRDHHGVA